MQSDRRRFFGTDAYEREIEELLAIGHCEDQIVIRNRNKELSLNIKVQIGDMDKGESKMENNNLELAIKFIQAISEGKTGEDLNKFYDESVHQIEYPNLLTKKITEREINALKEASIKGKQVISSQNYEIVRTYSCGNTVIIEAIWTGQLSIPLGKLQAGDEMKAYFAQFFEFRDGKIIKQRNYDCFENFL